MMGFVDLRLTSQIVEAFLAAEKGAEGGKGEKTGRVERELPRPLVERVEEALSVLERATVEGLAEVGDGPPGVTLAVLGGEVVEYLGAWSLLLQLVEEIPREDRGSLSSAMSRPGLLNNLVPTLLSLVPQRPRGVAEMETWGLEGLGVSEELLETKFVRVGEGGLGEYFLPGGWLVPWGARGGEVGRVGVGVGGRVGEDVVSRERWASRLFARLLTQYPGAVRQWVNGQSRGVASRVREYVEGGVSSVVIGWELEAVRERSAAAGTEEAALSLSVRREAREVLAVYAVEELRMELTIRLPRGYPLVKAEVEEGQRLRVAKDQWRRWMLQLSVLLEGSVVEGLEKWRRNVDQHLAGVEECPVCMMAVHLTTNQLPKLVCRQCKNKFHAACLYKWFHSSNNTTCPLCRNPFS